jgi:hypothetical protein
MRKDIVPHQDDKFLEFVMILLGYTKDHLSIWGIDPARLSEAEKLTVEYNDALTKVKNPNHGKADVALKNKCKYELEQFVRGFIKEHIAYNHLVSDDDRLRMGLHVHDDKPTPAAVSKTSPYAKIKKLGIGYVEIEFGDEEGVRKGKPLGQHGAEMRYIISDVRPTDWDQLTHSNFATRSPFRLSFKGDDRGKTLYFALRWENTRGEKGQWGEIMSIIIP